MQNILEQPPTIETARLIIRPLTMADDKAIYSYAQDSEVTRYVLFETHASIEDTRTFLQTALELYANGEPCPLGIVLKSERRLIGTTGYINWNEIHKRTEIGYVFSKDYWSNGFASEASTALIDRLFRDSDLMRIEARCDIRNIASARVMEKAGMKYEGILRKHIFTKGEHRDMKIYSILRDEWHRENNH